MTRLDGRRDPILLPLAALLDVPLVEAAQNVVPVAVTAGEVGREARNWAGGRCLSADKPGVYCRGVNRCRPAWPADQPRSVQQLKRRTGDFIEQLCSLARIVLGFPIGLLEAQHSRGAMVPRWTRSLRAIRLARRAGPFMASATWTRRHSTTSLRS